MFAKRNLAAADCQLRIMFCWKVYNNGRARGGRLSNFVLVAIARGRQNIACCFAGADFSPFLNFVVDCRGPGREMVVQLSRRPKARQWSFPCLPSAHARPRHARPMYTTPESCMPCTPVDSGISGLAGVSGYVSTTTGCGGKSRSAHATHNIGRARHHQRCWK